MSDHIEFILLCPETAPVQLSPEHQKELDLPKLTTVAKVREAVEAKKAPKPKPKAKTDKLIVKSEEITNL
tara:strand:- start:3364 stop:3573 length:210 start_codon:yes stop_codon:yes gene_type:complete